MSFSSRPARLLGAVVLAGTLGLTAACGSSSSPGTGSSSNSTAPVTEKVTIQGTSLSPQGKAVQLKVGQTLVLDITADKAGELHVHSSPEQHVEYPKGHSVKRLTFHQPGIIEIESHALEKTVFQVEVR